MLGPIVVISPSRPSLNRWNQRGPINRTSSGGLVTIVVTGNAKKTRLNSLNSVLAKLSAHQRVNRYGYYLRNIKASALQVDMIALLEAMNMPAFVLAPLLVF